MAKKRRKSDGDSAAKELIQSVETVARLKVLVSRAIRAGLVPIIYGDPGVGKTACLTDMVRVYKWGRVEVLIGSQCTPEDVNGFPVEGKPVRDAHGVDRPQVVYAPRDMFVRLNQEGGVLFFDELTCTPHSVQAPMLRGLNDGVFGDYALDLTRVARIGAANSADIAVNGSDLPGPTANRLVHLSYPTGDHARREWVQEFPGYWGSPPKIKVFGDELSEEYFLRARSFVAGFISVRPALWLDVPDDPVKLAGPWPSSRSWTAATRAIARTMADGDPPHEALDLVAGAVGPGAAAEFLNYVKDTDLPDPEAVLRNPSGFKLSGRADVDHANLSAVVAAVNANFTEDRFMACVEIVCERAAKEGKSLETSVGPYVTMTKLWVDRLGKLTPKAFQRYNIASQVFKPLQDMMKSAK